MAEYIEREAALAATCEYCSGANGGACDEKCADYSAILKIHTADVVEVVRCKDCKYFQPYEGEEHKGDCGELIGLESCVYEDDFCSYGERKG